jgi:hypothetical protein
MQQRQQQLSMPLHSSRRWLLVTLMAAVMTTSSFSSAFTTAPFVRVSSRVCSPSTFTSSSSSSSSRLAEATAAGAAMAKDEAPEPRTFREAEILGLKRMQQGNYGEALKGM